MGESGNGPDGGETITYCQPEVHERRLKRMALEEIRARLIAKGYTFGPVSAPSYDYLDDHVHFIACDVDEDFHGCETRYRPR